MQAFEMAIAWLWLLLTAAWVSTFFHRARVFAARRGFRYRRVRYASGAGAVAALLIMGIVNGSPERPAAAEPYVRHEADAAPTSPRAVSVVEPPSVPVPDGHEPDLWTNDTDGSHHVIDGEHKAGCVDRDFFNRLVAGVVSRAGRSELEKTTELSKDLMPALMTGECVIFDRDEPLEVIDHSDAALVHVQREDGKEYWTAKIFFQ